MITAITPTGDRPLAFALCQRWMQRQTVQADQWIVVDDGKVPMIPSGYMEYVRRKPQPGDPKHTLAINLKMALPLILGDKIIIIEDDEYYAPHYIETMAAHLDKYEIVGIMRAKYYHIVSGGYYTHRNTEHASLAQTAFKSSILPEFEKCLENGTSFLDIQLWKRHGNRAFLFVNNDEPLYLGIKGLPGRKGIGIGHNPAMYHNIKDTADRTMLKRWAPKDYQIYLDILSGKLTENNYKEYFGIAA